MNSIIIKALDFFDARLKVSMPDQSQDSKYQKYAAYADKHSLFDLMHSLTSKLMVARPVDPFQFMIDFLLASTCMNNLSSACH